MLFTQFLILTEFFWEALLIFIRRHGHHCVYRHQRWNL